MTDKAVSTEDLCIDVSRNASLEAARLEAVIRTLIENKADTLKNAKRKSSSITSSPKSLFTKLRGTSTSTVSSKEKEAPSHETKKSDTISGQHTQGIGYTDEGRSPSHSPRKPRPGRTREGGSERTFHFKEEDESADGRHKNSFSGQQCSSMDCSNSYCKKDPNVDNIQIHLDDDYIALNFDEHTNLGPEELAAMRALRRAQRKKRRRRKHLKKQLAMSAVAVELNHFKDLDEDELSKRARMTIIITAFLLLFMCLLLVGITLRMAPLIDDMVRKENQELMNALSHDQKIHENSIQNLTASVPIALK